MKRPALSIVIITLNEEARLPRLLDNLAAQTWTDFEIIHVDSQVTFRSSARSMAYRCRSSASPAASVAIRRSAICVPSWLSIG